jgi:chromosome segregation ATPase
MNEQIQKLERKISLNEEQRENLQKKIDYYEAYLKILDLKISNQKIQLLNLRRKEETNQE